MCENVETDLEQNIHAIKTLLKIIEIPVITVFDVTTSQSCHI